MSVGTQLPVEAKGMVLARWFSTYWPPWRPDLRERHWVRAMSRGRFLGSRQAGVSRRVAPPMAILAGHCPPDQRRWGVRAGRHGGRPPHGVRVPAVRRRPRIRRRRVRHPTRARSSPTLPGVISAHRARQSRPTVNRRATAPTRSTRRTSASSSHRPRAGRPSTSSRATCPTRRTQTRCWRRSPCNRTTGCISGP